MAITATVTRSELSLSTLSLNDATYGLMNDPQFDPGQVTYRREMATSPYVSGAVEVGAVRDITNGTLVVRVTAATHTALQAAVSSLISAFSQSSYTLTVGVGGASYGWTCQRASYSMAFDQTMRDHLVAKVTLVYPRSPAPASGPF